MKKRYSRPTVRTLTPAEAQAIFKKVREHRRLLNLVKGWAELYLWERGIDPKPRPPKWSEEATLPIYDPRTGETTEGRVNLEGRE